MSKINMSKFEPPEGAMPYELLLGVYRVSLAERDRLRAVNAELVDALNEVLSDITIPDEGWSVGSSVYNARVALAKAKQP